MPTMQSEPPSDALARRAILSAEVEIHLARSRMHLAQALMEMERRERLRLEQQLRMERAHRRRGLFGRRI